ncbi:DUF2442 domain-containing protein [Spirosoma areae]
MVKITQASYLSDCTIQFTFSDGSSNDVDFSPFLTASQNPMVTRFRDLTKFRKFRIEHSRSIIWGDRRMCFPVESLYKTAPVVQPIPADVADRWMKAVS